MFIEGFSAVFGNPMTVVLIFFGVAVGIVFGAIPGLTATMAVVMFLPLTYTMSPIMGIALLIALYIGGTSGGLISAILLMYFPAMLSSSPHPITVRLEKQILTLIFLENF